MKPKYRKGIFIVTYAKSKNKIFYLILKRKLHWKGWEFPKGGKEKFEFTKTAVKREIKEETGLSPIKIKKFKTKGKYKYKKNLKDRPEIIGQTYTLYSAQIQKKKIKFDKKEHSDHKWVDFKTAKRKLTWPNQKKCLKEVNDYLINVL
jgi:8-oxo-dGTP pyrophosphatase MutT (NUDIX family)